MSIFMSTSLNTALACTQSIRRLPSGSQNPWCSHAQNYNDPALSGDAWSLRGQSMKDLVEIFQLPCFDLETAGVTFAVPKLSFGIEPLSLSGLLSQYLCTLSHSLPLRILISLHLIHVYIIIPGIDSEKPVYITRPVHCPIFLLFLFILESSAPNNSSHSSLSSRVTENTCSLVVKVIEWEPVF